MSQPRKESVQQFVERNSPGAKAATNGFGTWWIEDTKGEMLSNKCGASETAWKSAKNKLQRFER